MKNRIIKLPQNMRALGARNRGNKAIRDPSGDKTSLLLHMEGSNDSTTFTDSSFFPKTVTANGNAKISTTQSKWGNGSGYFDGDGDYLEADYSSSFDPENSDWTVECWVYCTQLNSSSSSHICGTYSYGSVEGGSYNAGWQLGLAQATGNIGFGYGNNGSWITVVSSSTAPSLNAWCHIALVKVGSQYTIYLNGTSIGTASYGTNIQVTKTKFHIGGAINSGSFYYLYAGYIQDLRITKGIARYTANFTPSIMRLPDPKC